MAVSAFPAVVDALVTLSPAVMPAGRPVTVSDAIPAKDDPADFLAVGVQSLSNTGSVFAGDARQAWASIGAMSRDERGAVRCIAAARSIDETVKDARDQVFAIVEAVATLCRTNLSLGVPQVVQTSITRTQAGPLYEEGQPVAYVVEFEVEFTARI